MIVPFLFQTSEQNTLDLFLRLEGDLGGLWPSRGRTRNSLKEKGKIRRGPDPTRYRFPVCDDSFFFSFSVAQIFYMLRLWTRPLRPVLTASFSRRAMSQQSTPEFVSFFSQNHSCSCHLSLAAFWPLTLVPPWVPLRTCFRHQHSQPLENLF